MQGGGAPGVYNWLASVVQQRADPTFQRYLAAVQRHDAHQRGQLCLAAFRKACDAQLEQIDRCAPLCADRGHTCLLAHACFGARS